jgi:hypothetical protein
MTEQHTAPDEAPLDDEQAADAAGGLRGAAGATGRPLGDAAHLTANPLPLDPSDRAI